MEYQFRSAAKGNCRVQFRTAGKHGFAAPKIFQISCPDDPASPTITYRYSNNVVAGATSGELSNATLCRIAIAQFLLSPGHAQTEAPQALDTSIAPFEGAVLNAKGVVLTVGRLHSPRGMGRLCENRGNNSRTDKGDERGQLPPPRHDDGNASGQSG